MRGYGERERMLYFRELQKLRQELEEKKAESREAMTQSQETLSALRRETKSK
jgi:hypothetical protein